MLDHLITELNSRFAPESSQNAIEFMKLLPSAIKPSPTLQCCDFKNILKVCDDDLPSSVSFQSELQLWQQKWASENEIAAELNNPEKVLAHTDDDFFPNIHVLLRIMGTLPVTSCECERSISMLRILKTPLRSTMTQDRLNALAMLYCHRDVKLTPEVVEEFARRHPRRMLLENPFE